MAARSAPGLYVNDELVIPWSELELAAAKAGGPGGQNVNKVASKVVLRFSVARSRALGAERRALLLERLAGRISRGGEIVVQASRFRERQRNLEDAHERLAALLRQALAPAKRRVPTRPTAASRRRRLAEKRRRSERKGERRRLDG